MPDSEWTAETVPPELAALHDAPGGTSLHGLAGILNAYDRWQHEQAASIDRRDPAGLLRARIAERDRIFNAALERARRDATIGTWTVSCTNFGDHGKCAGLDDPITPYGCLCSCHDRWLEQRAERP